MIKKQVKSAYERLIEFENIYPKKVEVYRAFKKQSYEAAAEARAAWEAYYNRSWESPAANDYMELQDAIRRGDRVEVRERTQWARELRLQGDFIPKPKSIDPFWFANNQDMLTYQSLLFSYELEKKNGYPESTGIFD